MGLFLKFSLTLNNFNFLLFKDIKLEEELEFLKEKVQEEYLQRIRDEHENKMNYKNLINERRKFIESVFDDYEDYYNKYFYTL